jgi:replicative DNA helicase
VVADGAAAVPVQDTDAEGVVLAAVLIDGANALALVQDVLTEADFYSDANRLIWRAALALDEADEPIDVGTVANRLRASSDLAKAGGVPYLAQLTDATPAVMNVEAHARIVADKARQRRVTEVAHKVATEGYQHREDVTAWAQAAAQEITDIAIAGAEKDPTETFAELTPRVLDQMIKRSRGELSSRAVATGWHLYDDVMGGGYERGNVHIVAGRPGMGKSSFLVGTALNMAAAGTGVLIFSVEMPKEQIMQRAIAVESGVEIRKVRKSRMRREEWDAVTEATKRLNALPVSICYRAGARVSDIAGAIIREQRRLAAPLGLVVVDYMQLLDDEQAGESRATALARVSRRLVWLAGRYDVPLLVAAQLNRAVESRANANKRPGLADLRESGAIEQDAYSVSFLYRDDYYNKDSDWKGTAEVIVAKNRDAPTGMARLRWVGGCTRFENLDGEQQEELY